MAAPPANAAPSPYERANRYRPRDTQLLAAAKDLDTTIDPTAAKMLMDWVRGEYDARQGGVMMGLFAQCHLGAPYVDHRLDLLGNICEHFTAADPVPAPYGQARGLARSGAYAYIELYSDGAMVPILPDGTAVDLGSSDDSRARSN